MKHKIQLEDRVTPKGVLGLVIWLCSYMWTVGIVEWYWLSPTLALFIMIILGGIMLILGIEKPSMFKFALDGLTTLRDEKLTVGQRLAFAVELLQNFVGLTTHYAELKALEESEKEEKIPDPEEPDL